MKKTTVELLIDKEQKKARAPKVGGKKEKLTKKLKKELQKKAIKKTKSELKLLIQEKKLAKKTKNELQKQAMKKTEDELKDYKRLIRAGEKIRGFKLYDVPSQYVFSDRDFFIHNVEIIEDEKEKILIYIYNKIQSIGVGLNIQKNSVDDIILEGLKYRLIIEYFDKFEENLKRKNKKDLKLLNTFLLNSNVKKYIKNKKELNLWDDENMNIFWWKGGDFETEYIEKMNNRYILYRISKSEKEKARDYIIKKWVKKWVKKVVNNKNRIKKLQKELAIKDEIKREYNNRIKVVNSSLKNNPYLIKVNNYLNRYSQKIYDRIWLNDDKKALIEKIVSLQVELQKESLKKWDVKKKEKQLKELQKELQKIQKHKKEIEKRLIAPYIDTIQKINNHAINTKNKYYDEYLLKINNQNSKIKNIREKLKIEYSDIIQ